MPAVVEHPQVVREAGKRFGELFGGRPQRRHFAEYLTGLMIATNKTVSGINAEFAETTDQSCLNRFLTKAAWDEQALNEKRLAMLQEEPSTRYAERGVIAVDNVLVDHDGQLIEDVGWFWDHAEQRHKIAHDYLFANYVCPSGKPTRRPAEPAAGRPPLEFRRFKKREQCEATGKVFQDHTTLFRQLVDWVCEREIPGDFAFDSYFTNAPVLNHVHEKKNAQGESRAYVGDLKTNRKMEIRGRTMRADEFAATIDREDRREFRRGDDRQWYFTTSVRLPGVHHRVRIVILWNNRRDQTPTKIFVTNRTRWEVQRIVNVYRQRWTGTETFHRDGKQHLGMGDCQLRHGRGQTRHMYLAMLAYSLLMRELRTAKAKDWALTRLAAIGQACRAAIAETLRATLQWAVENAVGKSQPMKHVLDQLALT